MSPAHDALPVPLAPSDAAPCPENAPPSEQAVPTPPRLSSRALLGGRHEVEIDHDGVVYRLRQTALGKLILTK